MTSDVFGTVVTHIRLQQYKESMAMALCQIVVALIKMELHIVKRLLPVKKGSLVYTVHLMKRGDVKTVVISSHVKDNVQEKQSTETGETDPVTVGPIWLCSMPSKKK